MQEESACFSSTVFFLELLPLTRGREELWLRERRTGVTATEIKMLTMADNTEQAIQELIIKKILNKKIIKTIKI